jgi:hypothetical protein
MYKIRDNGELVHHMFVRHTDEPGCHSLTFARDVHRAAVAGFAHCSLYAEADCKAGTELPARWKNKKDKETTRLTPGSRWFLDPRGNVPVRSWECVKK